MTGPAPDYSLLFIELGSVAVGLAVLARLALGAGVSPPSLPARRSRVRQGWDCATQSHQGLHSAWRGDWSSSSAVRIARTRVFRRTFNPEPAQGFLWCGSGPASELSSWARTGFLLGWSPLASVLLGGITLISSSGIIARVLSELGRMNSPETPTVLSILVLEDLMIAVYLPLIAVLLAGGGPTESQFVSWNCMYRSSHWCSLLPRGMVTRSVHS